MNKPRIQLIGSLPTTVTIQNNYNNVGVIDMDETQEMTSLVEETLGQSKHLHQATSTGATSTGLSVSERKLIPASSHYSKTPYSKTPYSNNSRRVVMANIYQLQEELDREHQRLQLLFDITGSLS